MTDPTEPKFEVETNLMESNFNINEITSQFYESPFKNNSNNQNLLNKSLLNEFASNTEKLTSSK